MPAEVEVLYLICILLNLILHEDLGKIHQTEMYMAEEQQVPYNWILIGFR